jgi:hypothetical protein
VQDVQAHSRPRDGHRASVGEDIANGAQRYREANASISTLCNAVLVCIGAAEVCCESHVTQVRRADFLSVMVVVMVCGDARI